MPDITMCKEETCSFKLSCYRYMAKPSEYRQSYFLNKETIGESCDVYWRIDLEKNYGYTLINIDAAE